MRENKAMWKEEMNRKMVKYHDVTDKEEIRTEEARREYRENDGKEGRGAPRYSTVSTVDENLGMFMDGPCPGHVGMLGPGVWPFSICLKILLYLCGSITLEA
jgi:hypothetical protein